MERESFIDKASQIVESYAHEQSEKAGQRVIDLCSDGKKGACRCKNCLNEAVSEANSWLEWQEPDTGNTDRLVVMYDEKKRSFDIYVSSKD